MPLRLALCTSLTLALLAAPAGADAADVVTPSSVAASTTVPEGGARTLTLRCPGAAVALNAAVTRRGDGVDVVRSSPGVTAGDWRFRLAASSGPTARQRRVHAVLRCVSLALPSGVSGARLTVSTRRPPAVRVAPGSPADLRVRCPRGFISTGYGLAPTSFRDLTVAAAVPSARGWDFTIESLGGPPATTRAAVRCLKRTVSARRDGRTTQLRFAITRRVFSDAVGRRPGSSGALTHSCGATPFSIATGHALDPLDDIVIGDGGPAGPRTGRWTFRAASSDDVTTSYLVCLKRHTQFG